ncbi:MAG: hypothetical protein NZ583_04860 [Desulfobacterota bacterium]|nr:hypothetical protein [Thermodesulfobacteriota bacterium]MDW8002256.1 alpha-isopropylmalate synthase regulatory domain-containing protein [Deltaproteobacteria bacterium]
MERLIEVRDATKELSLIRSLDSYKRPFEVVGSYRLIDDGNMPEATVIIKTDSQEAHEAATGVGPVDALANVLKKSLTRVFPFIENVKLVDYSARVHDAKTGTAAKVEVSIVFSNGNDLWRVSEISENINAASFWALLDGFEYAIHLHYRSPNRLR